MRDGWSHAARFWARARGSATGAGVAFILAASGTYVALAGLDQLGSAPGAPPEPALARAEPVAEVWVDRGTPAWHGPVQPQSAPPVLGPADTLRVVTGRISAGGSLAETLQEQDVSPRVVFELTHAIRPVFDFRYARPGDFYRLVADHTEEVLSFEFQRGREIVYRLDRDPRGALVAEAGEVPLELRIIALSGVINRSLFASVLELGETADLVREFADIFIWDFDFSSQTRPGDEFRMIFEKYYDREGFVRYGKILAARYESVNRDFTSIYFEDESGYGDYYTPEGNSIRRAFLRAPLEYSRISSRYSRGRLHPILQVRRPHLGVDYAAPAGTPVWAVADGEVIYKGWQGGMGRQIKVRHNNGYVSYYAHLQRYGNVRVGSRVRQKEVVGYVGSSGLATGPHLDYRLKANGRFVDPLKVDFPTGEPVPLNALRAFGGIREDMLHRLDAAAPALVLEARQGTLAE
jgi:murein DD-endopeptidase MepM/ murein hydrolase activator NlpD